MTDTCDMEITPGVTCNRPGDHGGGCEPAPPRCLCSHPRSLHGRGVAQCYSAACGCSRMRVPAPATPEPTYRSAR